MFLIVAFKQLRAAEREGQSSQGRTRRNFGKVLIQVCSCPTKGGPFTLEVEVLKSFSQEKSKWLILE